MSYGVQSPRAEGHYNQRLQMRFDSTFHWLNMFKKMHTLIVGGCYWQCADFELYWSS